MSPPRIAIALQGGGSHAAFSAGLLAELLSPRHRDRFDLVALSGTSGGAVCAALAWAGLLQGGPDDAIARLTAFWDDLAARDPLDAWVNAWMQLAFRLPFSAQVSPYAYAPEAAPRLEALLRRHVAPQDLPADPAARRRPYLRVGVASVLGQGGAVLDGERFTIEDILASAAVPPLFRAQDARGTLWWDGLYAHNPPVRCLLRLPRKPAEIWVVRINPRTRKALPTTWEEIEDRRNEKAGNAPLEHELHAVALVNRMIRKNPAMKDQFGYLPVTVREVELPLPDLPYASKLDRSPRRIEELRNAGRDAAAGFFDAASITVPESGVITARP
jgi:NTE family protein